MRKLSSLVISLLVLGSVGMLGCTNLNDPYAGGYNGGYGGGYGGYNPPPPGYYGGGGYYGGPGYYGNPNNDRRERRELERERQRLEDERRRLEQERNRPNNAPPPFMGRPQPDRCPPGFSPSENKCSDAERRRGCRDMRLPSGLGCVSR